MLDASPTDMLAGMRDRTVLLAGLEVGLRRVEIAGLSAGDLPQSRGYDAIRLTRKGRWRDSLAFHPQAVQCIRAYLDQAGHGNDREKPLFRPLWVNVKPHSPSRKAHPCENVR